MGILIDPFPIYKYHCGVVNCIVFSSKSEFWPMSENNDANLATSPIVLLAQFDAQERGLNRLFLQIVGGYDVIEADNGVNLIKQLKKRPNIILLDTITQGGFLKALEIIRRNPELKHIPISIFSHEQHKLPECMRKGADGFIIKPSPPTSFLGKIWKLLGEEGQKNRAASSFANRFKRDIATIDNLPTLPTVYAEVERLCQNPDVSAEDLSKTIETDPSISLKLLNLANSAFFGFSRRIKSAHDAISLLGNQTVKNTVLNIAIFEATKNLKDSAGLDKNAFWLHSAAVGTIARFLCTRLELNRPEAFTAGIIHDMGKIIFDSLYKDFYTEVMSRVKMGDIFHLSSRRSHNWTQSLSNWPRIMRILAIATRFN